MHFVHIVLMGKKTGECGLDSTSLGQKPLPGSCPHGNEPSGIHKR